MFSVQTAPCVDNIYKERNRLKQEKIDIQNNIKRISQSHQDFGKRISKHPKVKSVRHIGVIFALDLDINVPRYGDLREKLLKFFMNNAVFLRPLGNTIYIQPPYVISENELEKVYDTIEAALDQI